MERIVCMHSKQEILIYASILEYLYPSKSVYSSYE
jgi:hypothetical protein